MSLPKLNEYPAYAGGVNRHIALYTNLYPWSRRVLLNAWLSGLARGDQCRLTGSGNALEALRDDALYKYPYFTFCRAMLCISAAYAIMRCLSLCVCLSVTFVNSVNTSNHIFKNVSPSGSQAILVFPHQTAWQYSDGNPLGLMGASNAGGVGRNRDSESISGFTAYAVKRSSGKCSKLSCDEPWRVYNTSRW